MTMPHIHGRHRTVPASLLLETIGASLAAIKKADGATFADLGAVLGKSEDRAAAYAGGEGDMGVVSFLRGCRTWDGRFANDVFALLGMRLIPVPTVRATRETVLTLLGQQSKEASDLTGALCAGLADGTLCGDDARKAHAEAQQLLAVIFAIVAELELIIREDQ